MWHFQLKLSSRSIKNTLGDMNGDGFVDTVDASVILAEYARLSTE